MHIPSCKHHTWLTLLPSQPNCDKIRELRMEFEEDGRVKNNVLLHTNSWNLAFPDVNNRNNLGSICTQLNIIWCFQSVGKIDFSIL